MHIRVQGIGPVGGFGAGASDFEALLDGTKEVLPEVDRIEKGGELLEHSWFKAKSSRLETYIPKKKLRRIDRFSTLALLGASIAIDDAGFSPGDLENTGIIVATGYGAAGTTFSFLDSFLDKGDSLSMPTHFSNSVHNAAAAHISILLGLKGPCLTVSQFDLSIPSAFFTAVSWLLEERVESVLVGGVDEHTPLLGYATAVFNSKGKSPYPIAGEGGCFFLLARERRDKGEGYAKLGKAQIFDPTTKAVSFDNQTVILGSSGYGGEHGNGVDHPFVSYGSLYGHFPAAAALDLAVGCLSLRNKILYTPSRGLGGELVVQPEGSRVIHCIKPGNDHLWGAVSLETPGKKG